MTPKRQYMTQKCEYSTFHDDLEATAMSVDYTGKWVLLCGRRDIALQNLNREDENQTLLHKFHRNSKHEVSAAEWASHASSKEYCAIATSQLIEVVTWKLGDPTLIHSLRAHTRVVTDIDWHSKVPHLLASCSVDTFTHLWDLRDPRKPILSLSAVCMSGATQVGFNRVSGNLIATAHDGDLRIWDRRKGSCPVQYITAHLARIHGINWSHEEETRLTTASQDGTVKYFDINHPRKAEAIITTDSIVWRARYTPFCNGLVTIIVPHLERGSNSLRLWNNSHQSTPICEFEGHKDAILDFAFRPNHNQSPDRELISWSRDQTLRVWKVSEALQKRCASDFFENEDENFVIDDFALLKTQSSNRTPSMSQSSCGLQHEFSLLNTNIPHIDIQQLDSKNRQATMKISANGHLVLLSVTFPLKYPEHNESPEFSYCQGTSLDQNLSLQLMKKLKLTAYERVKKGRPCLEPCLRALVTALKKTTSGDEKGHMRLQSPRLEGALSGALHDACVPFPKTSGARFCHVNMLITFTCPINTQRIGIKPHQTTPRALSALSGGYLGNVMGNKPILYAQRESSTTPLYLPDKVGRSRKISQKFIASNVVVYDASKLLLINRDIAEMYTINATDKKQMCQHNLAIARAVNRPDLVQYWKMAEMVASHLNVIERDMRLVPNARLFGINLIDSLIKAALKNYDLQSAAMLSCAFGRHSRPVRRNDSLSMDSRTIVSTNDFYQENQPDLFHLPDSKYHDQFKLAYAEILNRWQLIVPKTKVMKFLGGVEQAVSREEIILECWNCKSNCDGIVCFKCRKNLLKCTICLLPVKGMTNLCAKCGHGGHSQHLAEWFEKSDVCASGCGCYCILDT